MKRIMTVLAVAGLCAAAAKPAMAQGTTLGIGVGITNPMSDWGDKNTIGDKMGFHLGVGGSFALGTAPVRLRVEGTYTQTSHQTGVDGNTKLIGGMVSLVYPFATAGKIKPYILGGVGLYNNKFSANGADTSKTGGGLGVGGRQGLSGACGWVAREGTRRREEPGHAATSTGRPLRTLAEGPSAVQGT